MPRRRAASARPTQFSGAEPPILKDLKVNSARLVDVVLEIEDAFEIEVRDEDADKVKTIGDAVKLILAAKA